MRNVYLKVMFGTKFHVDAGFLHKIGEINEASNWNPTAVNQKDVGG